MEKVKINPNNFKYYSDSFIMGFECGVNKQYEADMKSLSEHGKGKWIEGVQCSECDWINEVESGFIARANFNFCPNCGADMRSKE